MMEFVQLLPSLAVSPYLIDFPTRGAVFVHQPLDFSVLQAAQIAFNPSLRVFRELEGYVTLDGPVRKSVQVSRKPLWISQASHPISPYEV
jgi:hypothetical protein